MEIPLLITHPYFLQLIDISPNDLNHDLEKMIKWAFQ